MKPVNRHPKSPCANCPYRKDAPRKHWHRIEFKKLLEDEKPTSLGHVYACHKQADIAPEKRGMCAGWLLDQKNRNVPSIRLRMLLASDDSAVAAIREVTNGGHELFSTVKAMCRANGVRP